MSSSKSKIRVASEHAGQIVTITLDDAPGNVIDIEMVEEIRVAIVGLDDMPALKAVVFEGAGDHFSYGASIPEHQPDRVADLIPRFHALFRELLELDRPLCAVVRGRCLGGGLELAAFCSRIFATPDAELGVPEIKLGVFAPLASLLLPERMGRSQAEDLCLTGRIIRGDEAQRLRLVDVVSEAPERAARAWLEDAVLPKSAVALRYATRAVRQSLRSWFVPALDELERLYLEDLMAHEDPREGIAAFLEKRPPTWKNR